MNLSDREIEMISKISKQRRIRKQSAWIALSATLGTLIAVVYFDFHTSSLGPTVAVLLGIAVGEVAGTYFRVRSEDKLIDLLLRYVNSDPEALRQFSLKAAGSERAA